MRQLNYAKLCSDIQNWIKNYVKNAKADGVILGISGGIDSAVVAALCVNALGKEKVTGVGLPCESIPQDLEDAKLIAKYLGFSFSIFDLTSIYKEFLKQIQPKTELNKMATANIKPRLRMITLYFIGQSKGKWLVIGTGNRTEIAIGYFTKYGDGGIDFNPIGALYKCEVRELARFLKLPEKVIVKPPSAGLWEGQTDEGEIGLPYKILDELIYCIDYNLELKGFKKEDVEKIRNMIRAADHKVKLPPIFKV